MWFKVKNKHIIFHVRYINVLLSLFHLSETLLILNFTKLIILKSEVCSDWPAIKYVVIGPIPQAYDENVTPLTILGNKYTVSPQHGDGSNNNIARIKVMSSFFA